MKGSYILLVHLPEAGAITVGRLGKLDFARGHYAYIGSAMGGIKARLNHHLHRTRRPHWHIDYLRDRASVTSIIICESDQRHECAIAQTLMGQLDCIPGFGASDCRCRSHLFFSASENQLKQAIRATLDRLGLPMSLKPVGIRCLQPIKATASSYPG